jgi:molecular chaperone GrpE
MEVENEVEPVEESIVFSNEEYNKLREKAKEAVNIYDKYIHLKAEFENYKKFMERQKINYLNYGTESILKELINIYDDLKRAVNADEPKLNQGLILILNNFSALLKREGVESIEAAGKQFDPDLHECVVVEHNPALPDNSITGVVEEGYKLKGKVLRPSKVMVNKLKGVEENGR